MAAQARRSAIVGRCCVWALVALLSGCALQPSGTSAPHFLNRAVAAAYIPLQGSVDVLWEGVGAATVVAPGIAATAAHNRGLIDPGLVIGRSPDYDLMFFRTSRRAVPLQAEPQLGQEVIAYGHGVDRGDLREAAGPVRFTTAPVLPECPSCPVQHAFTYAAQAGPGFSGGPVIAVKSGRLVGITFGFRNGMDDKHPKARLMYAYDMKRVLRELSKVLARTARGHPLAVR